MKIFIGCASRDEIPNKYYESCKELLENIFTTGHDLVFGACNKGLMGLTYEVATKNDSSVTGVYPVFYQNEAEPLNCVKMPVKTISERTDTIIEQSDVLVFLPGGIGTLYELLTAIESKRACEHQCPIIIYNCKGFYDNILMQLNKMKEEKFISSTDEQYYNVCSTVEEIIKYLKNYNK